MHPLNHDPPLRDVDERWFAVRCIFSWGDSQREGGYLYEERITLWLAEGFDEAIALAEREAVNHAEILDGSYLGVAQCYHLGLTEAPHAGDEVFSLMRDSVLEPDAYVDAHFATGSERETTDPA